MHCTQGQAGSSYKQPSECKLELPARVPSLSTSQDWASELGLATLPYMHLAGRKKGDWWKFPVKQGALSGLSHCHPTECSMVMSINKERPGSGYFGHWLSNFFKDPVIQGVTELGPSGMKRTSRNDDRSRVTQAVLRVKTVLEKADNIGTGCPPPVRLPSLPDG